MEDENESLLTGYPNTITYNCTKKILEQMKKNICKIKIKENQGTGFFCKIPFPDINNMLPVFITNNNIIDEKYLNQKDAKIQLDIKEKADKININLSNRMKYTNEDYDITIIEIKEKDNISNYLELDDIIMDDLLNNKNQNKEYEDKTIYIIQYPKGELSVSYGVLSNITLDKIYNFNHKCGTEKGSSGSPILTLNNKIFAIHKKAGLNFNKGTFLNFPLKEFIKKHYNNKSNNKVNDEYEKSNNMNIQNSIDETIDDSQDIETIREKIVFIGDEFVGKNEIIKKLISNEEYNGEYITSIGLDFLTKTIKYKNRHFSFQLYSTAGQEKFRALIPSYVRGSALIFLIYNINSRKSFNNLESWINLIYSTEKTKIVICGNKIHLEKREVDEKEGEEFAKKFGQTFFEVDSRTSIRSMFYYSIAELSIFEGKIDDKDKFVKEQIEKDENELFNSANKEKYNNKEFNNIKIINSKEEKNKNNKGCIIF